MEFTDKGQQGVRRASPSGSPSAARRSSCRPGTPTARAAPASASRSRWTTRIVSLATIDFRENPEGIDGRTGAQINGIGQHPGDPGPGREPAHRRAADRAEAGLPDPGLGDARPAGARPGPARGRRRPGADDPLPAGLLPRARRGRGDHAADLRDLPVRAGQADPDHAHPAGHRGHDPHARRGGRRQHRHLRANKGGGAEPGGRSRPPSPTATRRRCARSSTPTSSRSASRSSCSRSPPRASRASRSRSGIGTIVSLFTAVLATSAILGAMARTRVIGSRFAHRRRQATRGALLALRLRRQVEVVLLDVGHDPGDRRAGHRRPRASSSASTSSRARGSRRRSSAAPTSTRCATRSRRSGYGDAKIQKVDEPELGDNVFQISTSTLEPERGAPRCATRSTRSSASSAGRLLVELDRPDVRRPDRAHGADRDHRVAAPDLDLHRAAIRGQVRRAGADRAGPRHPHHRRACTPSSAGR